MRNTFDRGVVYWLSSFAWSNKGLPLETSALYLLSGGNLTRFISNFHIIYLNDYLRSMKYFHVGVSYDGPRGTRCKQKREPLQIKKTGALQTKKQKPQRRKEDLLNAGVRCNKKTTQIMSGTALYPRQNSMFSFQIRVRI